MVLLDSEVFLKELTKMFQKARDSTSVTLVFKRYDGRTRPVPREGRPPLPAPQEHMCLVRAKSRTKKLSTVIHSKDITKFQMAYFSVLKSNMDGLKKFKKRPKAKSAE